MVAKQKDMLPTVSVVGLGKIGLTLAAAFTKSGYRVYGADINKQVVESVNQGKSHIKNEPGLDELVLKAHQNQLLSATTNTAEAVAKADIIIVIVPVLITDQNKIDYQWIDQAVSSIAKGLQKDSLVIFETTLPPGDTRNRFGKMIENISGLQLGKDFHLSYSPERVYSNRILQDLKNYPKIIGSTNRESLQRTSDFYKNALGCDVIELSSIEAAEFAKVAESVYRDVNIALVNELAVFAEKKGVDITEVIQASNSQPYSHLHAPGIGVGGHCIPIYPYFFINNGLEEGIISLARNKNDSMARYAVEKIEQQTGNLQNKNILILGLSYRENVKEATKSTTLLLIDLLKQKQGNVYVHDPLFSDEEIKRYGAQPLALSDPLIRHVDIIILQTFHDEYKHLDYRQFSNCKLILDGRNKIDKNEILKLGIRYEGIGRKGEP